MRKAERFVEKHTKYVIMLVEKNLCPTDEDVIKLSGPMSRLRMDARHYQQHMLVQAGGRLGYKRNIDNVMCPHENIPGVFLATKSAEYFINRVL